MIAIRFGSSSWETAAEAIGVVSALSISVLS
jgi:hypothetical protein